MINFQQSLTDILRKNIPESQDLRLALEILDDGCCPICYSGLTEKGGCYECGIKTYFPKHKPL